MMEITSTVSSYLPAAFLLRLTSFHAEAWKVKQHASLAKKIKLKSTSGQASVSINFVRTLQETRQICGIWKLRPAYSRKTPNLGQNRWCFVPCDLEIWWMTLENNRAFLLCCFKLCATFHSHWWILTGVTVRKRPIWVKFDHLLSRVTFKFERWPWKNNRASLLCYFKLYA